MNPTNILASNGKRMPCGASQCQASLETALKTGSVYTASRATRRQMPWHGGSAMEPPAHCHGNVPITLSCLQGFCMSLMGKHRRTDRTAHTKELKNQPSLTLCLSPSGLPKSSSNFLSHSVLFHYLSISLQPSLSLKKHSLLCQSFSESPLCLSPFQTVGPSPHLASDECHLVSERESMSERERERKKENEGD